MNHGWLYTPGKYVCNTGGIANDPEYQLWTQLKQRCNPSFWIGNPSYEGTTASSEFMNFQSFAEWCNSQIGFASHYQLDKDLLVKGNKHYSRNTCVFLPMKLNCLIRLNKYRRGDLPIGVSWNTAKKKYQSTMKVGGLNIFVGRFNTIEETFFAYKTAKEDCIKKEASSYQSMIDPKAYQALLDFKINIDD